MRLFYYIHIGFSKKAFYQILDKQLGAKAYYYVMIKLPMACLTLNRLHRKSDSRTWNKQSNKKCLQTKIVYKQKLCAYKMSNELY